MAKITSLLLATTAFLATHSLAAGPTPAFKNEVLMPHSKYRAGYGAIPLTWSDALYTATLQWASQCKYRYSQTGGKYGENIYPSGGNRGTFDQSLKTWMSEATIYNYANPVFSGATGGFTQVVWKSTTQVACAMVDCPKGTVFTKLASKFTVCRYSPPGNLEGKFENNVGH